MTLDVESDARATKSFDEAIAEIPSCALDETGLREQRERYVRLSADVARLDRQDDAVLVHFVEGFDRPTLVKTVAVERQCCSFFQFHFDEAKRRLRIAVREPEQAPALDALAHSLQTARGARGTQDP